MTTNSFTGGEQGRPTTALRALRRRWPVVLLCMVLVPGAALGISLLQKKQYSAAASLLFRDPQFDTKLFNSPSTGGTTDPTREGETNLQLVSLPVVAQRTAQAIGRGLTQDDIQGKVAVSPKGQSDVISITATDHSPAFAARLANTFASQFITFRRDADRAKIQGALRLVNNQLRQLGRGDAARRRSLQSRSEQLGLLASLQTGNAELVQAAEVPTSASSPKPVRNTLLALVVGIVLGVALALLFERLDRRLKDPDEISEAFDRPILGVIPESRAIAAADHKKQRLAAGEAEAFRMLRANLRYFNVDHAINSVLITSSAPADGKSTVATHLAFAAAGAGSRVILIEADLRHPTLARRLGLPGSSGLSQLLAGEVDSISDVADRVAVSAVSQPGERGYRTVDVVTSGPIPPNPTDLIESERMRELIRTAESEYDLVIVDTPPTSVVSDAIPLVKEVSGVIVVSRLGKTTRESATHLRRQLENLEANTLGVVVNSISTRQSGYYGYGYGYGYGESAEDDAGAKVRRKAETEPLPAPEPVRDADDRDADDRNGHAPEREPVAQSAPGSTNGGGSDHPAAPPAGAAPQAGGLVGRLSRRRQPPRSPKG